MTDGLYEPDYEKWDMENRSEKLAEEAFHKLIPNPFDMNTFATDLFRTLAARREASR